MSNFKKYKKIIQDQICLSYLFLTGQYDYKIITGTETTVMNSYAFLIFSNEFKVFYFEIKNRILLGGGVFFNRIFTFSLK